MGKRGRPIFWTEERVRAHKAECKGNTATCETCKLISSSQHRRGILPVSMSKVERPKAPQVPVPAHQTAPVSSGSRGTAAKFNRETRHILERDSFFYNQVFQGSLHVILGMDDRHPRWEQINTFVKWCESQAFLGKRTLYRAEQKAFEMNLMKKVETGPEKTPGP